MTIHHPDHNPYRPFTTRQRVDKAVQTLQGFVRGISIDNELNSTEVAELMNWGREYADLLGKAPFNELKEKLDEILSDGQIDPEELEDLLWVCRNLSPESDYFDAVTHDIQQLHGIMHGIMADGLVTVEEAAGLQAWLDDHADLKGTYPYDELDSLLTVILKDKQIDQQEQEMLRSFFEDFIDYSLAKKVRAESLRVKSALTKSFTLPGVCAMCPEVEFDGRVFTFTGTSTKATRQQIVDQITGLGAAFSPNVTSRTHYLVVGAGGNPCWAFSCYGRKVEKAVDFRKSGGAIVIVHESDFWDAVADNG
jgi:NAD-dependent DNA ligase